MVFGNFRKFFGVFWDWGIGRDMVGVGLRNGNWGWGWGGGCVQQEPHVFLENFTKCQKATFFKNDEF